MPSSSSGRYGRVIRFKNATFNSFVAWLTEKTLQCRGQDCNIRDSHTLTLKQ